MRVAPVISNYIRYPYSVKKISKNADIPFDTASMGYLNKNEYFSARFLKAKTNEDNNTATQQTEVSNKVESGDIEKREKNSQYNRYIKPYSIHYFDDSIDLYRNSGKKWEEAPEIKFVKRKDGNNVILKVKPAIVNKNGTGRAGEFNLLVMSGNDTIIASNLYMHTDGKFDDYGNQYLNELKDAMIELSDIISSDEFKKDFGTSDVLNEALSGAIQYADSKK